MKVCIRCGAELDDACRFCQKCGMPQNEAPVNAESAEPVLENAAPVEAPVSETSAESAPAEPVAVAVEGATADETAPAAEAPAANAAYAQAGIPAGAPIGVIPSAQPEAPKAKKKKPIALFIIIGVLVLALIVAGIIAAVKLAGKGGSTSSYEERPLVYMNDDDELCFAPLGKTETTVINDDYDDYNVYFSGDNKYIAYLAYDENDYSYDLFVRNVDSVKPNKKMDDERGLKVASSVESVAFSNDGKLLFYLKDNGGLYVYNWEDSEKISSSVDSMTVNGSLVGYIKSSSSKRAFYVYNAADKNAEPEKIIKDIGYNYYFNDDFTTVFYTKSDDYSDFGDIYVYTAKNGSEKIVSDAILRDADPETGKLIYSTEGESLYLSDFIKDDLKESDAAMTEPNEDDYEDFFDYWSALDDYDDKLARDSFREEAKSVPAYTAQDLYLYTGKGDDTLLSSNVSGYVSSCFDGDMYLFTVSEMGADGKINISDIGYYDLHYPDKYTLNYYLDDIDASSSLVLANAKGETSVISDNATDYTRCSFNPSDDNQMYFYDEDECVLYYVNCNNGKPEKPVEVTDDISGAACFDGDKLYFFADYDYETGCATLYYTEKGAKPVKVVSDCDASMYGFDICDGSVFCITDVDDSNWCGDFGVIKANGDKEDIESDVFSFDIRNAKCIYIKKNYDRDDGIFDLYLYNGKESVAVAEDVTYVF